MWINEGLSNIRASHFELGMRSAVWFACVRVHVCGFRLNVLTIGTTMTFCMTVVYSSFHVEVAELYFSLVFFRFVFPIRTTATALVFQQSSGQICGIKWVYGVKRIIQRILLLLRIWNLVTTKLFAFQTCILSNSILEWKKNTLESISSFWFANRRVYNKTHQLIDC